MAAMTIWEIWKERNASVFKRTARSVQQIMCTIMDEARTWVFAGNKGLEMILSTTIVSHIALQRVLPP
jgi:hypothetical protein